MNKDKHIEEMAKDILKCSCVGTCLECEYATVTEDDYACIDGKIAEGLYNAGYRKASELISEIDNALHDMAMEYHTAGHPEYFAVCEMVHHKVIAPFEKKYTEKGE